MKKIWLAALALALFAFGCAGSNFIKLKYTPVGVDNGGPCVKTVSVVRFKDQNGNKPIGDRQGVPLYTDNQEVGEWVAKSIKSQLVALGCQAAYHDADGTFSTDYTVVGQITKVKVRQPSSTEASVDLRFALSVMKAGNDLFTYEYSSSVEVKKLPSSSLVPDAMEECLQEILSKQVMSDLLKVMR